MAVARSPIPLVALAVFQPEYHQNSFWIFVGLHQVATTLSASWDAITHFGTLESRSPPQPNTNHLSRNKGRAAFSKFSKLSGVYSIIYPHCLATELFCKHSIRPWYSEIAAVVGN